jgi:uncharacterized membrane-anchored protein YjiN (DUF445 family)
MNTKKVFQPMVIDLWLSNNLLTYQDISNKLDNKVAATTIKKWFSNASFIDKVYKQYMVSTGLQLPKVIDSMIREALEGNVQAGRLVLEHFGKLDKKIKVQIESPFEKFLKTSIMDDDSIEEAEIDEDVFGELQKITIKDDNDENEFESKLGDYVPAFNLLPERNENANSIGRVVKENKQAKKVKEEVISKSKRAEINKRGYRLKIRAEKVGLKRLFGRPPKHKFKLWIKELERLEIIKFGNIQI